MKIKGVLLLSGATFIIGILILVSGIKGTIEVNIQSRDYEITEGYLYDYEIYSEGGYDAVKKIHTNDTYRLIYHYYVDGKEYEISTDMGVGIVPEMGNTREVRYNSDNPRDAFLLGPNGNVFKIFFGLFFSVISSFFLWILLPEKKQKEENNRY